VTFQASNALGWETYKRVESRYGQPDAPPFQRSDPKAPLTAFLLERDSKAASSNARACTGGSSSAGVVVQQRRDRGGMRWGNTALSAARSACVSAVQAAVGDVDALQRAAPMVVSSFKHAANEWDAAAAATADPFMYINAKAERLTASPSATLRHESSQMHAPAATKEVIDGDETVRLL